MGSGDVVKREQSRAEELVVGRASQKKISSGVTSGIISIIYKCNSNGW